MVLCVFCYFSFFFYFSFVYCRRNHNEKKRRSLKNATLLIACTWLCVCVCDARERARNCWVLLRVMVVIKIWQGLQVKMECKQTHLIPQCFTCTRGYINSNWNIVDSLSAYCVRLYCMGIFSFFFFFKFCMLQNCYRSVFRNANELPFNSSMV